MSHSVKSIRKQFKDNGVFYTPPELAEYMRKLFPADVAEIYDPTCGGGALLEVFGPDCRKYGQELDAQRMEECRQRIPNFEGYAGDTLTDDKFAGRKFKYIIGNPPFSVKWEPTQDPRFDGPPALAPRSKADYAFILHILSHLTDDGRAVVMEFPGILYRGAAEGKIRRWLVEQNWVEEVIAIPGGKFEDTAIATCVIVFSKSKTSTAIKFRDEELGLERVVELDEVEQAGYNLSVSTYVQPPDTREPVDIKALNLEQEQHVINHIRKSLAYTRMLYEIFPQDCRPEGFGSFLADIKKVVGEFEDGCA